MQSSVSYTNSWHFTPQQDQASLAAHIWGKCKSPCLASVQTNHHAEIYYISLCGWNHSGDSRSCTLPKSHRIDLVLANIFLPRKKMLIWMSGPLDTSGLDGTVSGMSKTKTRKLICAFMWHEHIDTFLRVEEAEKVAPAVGAYRSTTEGSSVFILIIHLIKEEGFESSFEHWHCVSLLDPQLVPKNQGLPPWLLLETRETTRKPAFWERSSLFGWEVLT